MIHQKKAPLIASLLYILGYGLQFFIESKRLDLWLLVGWLLNLITTLGFCLHYLLKKTSPRTSKEFLLPFITNTIMVAALTLYYLPLTYFNPEINWTLKSEFLGQKASREVSPDMMILLFPMIQWCLIGVTFIFSISNKKKFFYTLIIGATASIFMFFAFAVIKTKFQNWKSKRCESFHFQNIQKLFPINSSLEDKMEHCSEEGYSCEKREEKIFISPHHSCPLSQRDFCGFWITLTKGKITEITREGACH